MANIFIFHGIYGHPGENWFPWLSDELGKENIKVIVPAFPDPDKPQFAEWIKHMKQYEALMDNKSIFIGHSLGGAFALRLLERIPLRIASTFLVSSVWEPPENEFDPLMRTFTEMPYDWNAIINHSRSFHVIHGDNDPYLSIPYARSLARNLNTELTIVKKGGHLNASAGFTSFPLLLDAIKKTVHKTAA